MPNDKFDWGPSLAAIKLVSEAPDGRGVVKCPKCGGDLQYIKSMSKRGRMAARAKCDTKDCLEFMS